MKGLDHLLSAVSRSFYLSMRFLPREMRSGVAVGYLLARATDTVADAVDMDCRERLALLRMMGETVAGAASREVAATCFGRLGVLSTIQTHRGEADLLARFPECLALLENLSPHERTLVRQVLAWGPSYVGCMGSRKKRAFLRTALAEAGFAPEQIDAVHLPIGLEIGARTPAEIAVSVAAELIAHRAALRGGGSGPCPA